ncbi:cytochrome b562 [Acerihabitans sp.]|uniref:cytochrome b562 n=1 Tax=Acerihabitans sp. TaxID=2811394 RepID=UPI002EDA68C3
MLSAALFIAAPLASQARDLGEDMDVLNANYSKVMKSDNLDALKKGLAAMHEAALDARNATPPKLKGQPADSPQMKDFRQGIDTLTSQIERAQALAAKGDLKQAQAVAKEFQQTRNENHAKFR